MCKRCSKCDKIQPIGGFYYKKNSNSDQYSSHCKECIKQYQQKNKKKTMLQRKQHYQINKEQMILKAKQYRENNKEQIALRRMQHRQDHRIKINIQERQHYQINKKKITAHKRHSWHTNYQHKLRRILRTRLYQALKNHSKKGSAVIDLGCSILELKQHLENQFKPDMTWKNWSVKGWHIDHVKPLSKFDLADRKQLLEAVHYTNLQPLWAKENLSKGAKSLTFF